MARPPRIEFEGAFYHITSRGNEKKRIFYTETDYKQFKKYVKDAELKYGAIFHCYVLMPNHYHLLVETPKANLNRIMHYINGSYTTYINIKRKHIGHLLQGRYKSIIVDRDNYLYELSRYIHLNPVRAGLVNRPEEYEYSSYRAYVSYVTDEIVTTEFLEDMTSKKAYQVYVDSAIGKETESPMTDIYAGTILGKEDFIQNTLARLENASLDNKNVSQRNQMKIALRTDDILHCVSEYFKVPIQELMNEESGILRKTSVYLLKKHTGSSNRQIGQLFGGINPTTISKINQRVCHQLEGDLTLGKAISEIEKNLSYVEA